MRVWGKESGLLKTGLIPIVIYIAFWVSVDTGFVNRKTVIAGNVVFLILSVFSSPAADGGVQATVAACTRANSVKSLNSPTYGKSVVRGGSNHGAGANS